MKNQIRLLLSLLMVLAVHQVIAQITVKGKVLDEENEGLFGANVIVKGTTMGTSSDLDGKFTITLPEGKTTLVIKGIGYTTKEVEAKAGEELTVQMEEDLIGLNEVVVVALGVTREKKNIGYAIQELKGSDITKSTENNVVNSLSGNVAGAVVTQSSGGVGASTRITLRGFTSISGNNQPLFVVDGIPFENSVAGNATGTRNSVDYGSSISDINPDDVESISVLKGAAAAALYGSRAQNGVVIIKTKSGASTKGLGVSYTFDVGFSNPLILPDFQNSYGQGFDKQFNYVDGTWGGVNDGWDESWGPAFESSINAKDGIDNNGDGTIDEANEAANLDQYHGKNKPWVASPDNMKDFMVTGVNLVNNVSISAGNDKANARFSYANTNQTGMVENEDYGKNQFTLNSSINMSSRVSADLKAAYTSTVSDNRNGVGYSGSGGRNVFNEFIWSGRQVDFAGHLKNYWKDEENLEQYNWNSAYWNNPYFQLNENLNSMQRNRFNGLIKLNYKINDWLSVFGRIGNDTYDQKIKQITAMGTFGAPSGGVYEEYYKFSERNVDFLATANKRFGDNIAFDASVGGNRMYQKSDWTSTDISVLTVPGIYTAKNNAGDFINDQYNKQKAVNSLYGTANVTFNSFFNVGLSYRRDWSSTLPSDNNSYGYPGISTSIILSEVLELPDAISFLKLRANYAEVGADTDPYSLSPVYSSGSVFNGVTPMYLPNSLPNNNLKPERTKSFELGTDIKLLNGRIGLDVSYYKANSVDQIMNLDLSFGSGFSSRIINAGDIQNNGWEITASGKILDKKDGLNWTLGVNWAKNNSKVVKLADGVDQIVLAGWGNVITVAELDQPFGTIKGNVYKRDESGNIIVDATGMPTYEDGVLGRATPDWKMGINNSFSYKNFSADFMIDISQGGDMYSLTHRYGFYAGQFAETAVGSDREDGVLIAGVNEDGTTNSTRVPAQTYWHKAALNERDMVDASYIKLRSASIGYSFDKELVEKLKLNRLKVSVYGRNLLLISENTRHFDPESAISGDGLGNLGFAWAQTPSARTIGVKLTAGF